MNTWKVEVRWGEFDEEGATGMFPNTVCEEGAEAGNEELGLLASASTFPIPPTDIWIFWFFWQWPFSPLVK